MKSYTALRAITIQGGRFILNGRPLPLHLVLDQGYWEGSGQTAPNDDAFIRDILLVKALGFNGVRKHQKIEDPRFLYWADHLGLLVWEEMPSAYRYTKRSVERLTREWIEVLKRDWNHPCIVSWVPFNESWGVPDLPDSPAQRHRPLCVQQFVSGTEHLEGTGLGLWLSHGIAKKHNGAISCRNSVRQMEERDDVPAVASRLETEDRGRQTEVGQELTLSPETDTKNAG